VILFLFLLLCVPIPLLNSMGNPRLAGLHGSDFMQLNAASLCFGVGLGILVGGRKLPGE
jgi:hypothetical protein